MNLNSTITSYDILNYTKTNLKVYILINSKIQLSELAQG